MTKKSKTNIVKPPIDLSIEDENITVDFYIDGKENELVAWIAFPWYGEFISIAEAKNARKIAKWFLQYADWKEQNDK